MRHIKAYSTGELFFLYWKGKLQPTEGRRAENIYQYVFLFPEQAEYFTLKSNYRENVPLSEICDFLTPTN